MILWTVKLFGMVRQAIAGRKHPNQLAWAVAFGVLLGIVPHGNLLAICLLVLVLSLRINHAMAGLTAIAASFFASKLDPASHALGQFLLTRPDVAETAKTAWGYPMVAWTDLNNTVVLGSFTLGLSALLPLFLVTYPIFRLVAPGKPSQEADSAPDTGLDQKVDPRQVQTVLIQQATHSVPAPKHTAIAAASHNTVSSQNTLSPPNQPVSSPDADPVQFMEIQQADPIDHQDDPVVETRIDVIRVKEASHQPSRPSTRAAGTETDWPQAGKSSGGGSDRGNKPMDEALNYLLRQLRDSQTRNAA